MRNCCATVYDPHTLRVHRLLQKVREKTGMPGLACRPSVEDRTMILAQAKLIVEEMFELLEALGIRIIVEGVGFVAPDKLALHQHKLPDNDHLPHIAKEIADLSVVTHGMFCQLGIGSRPVLEAVDENNLAKFGPGGYLDENQKWRKPPNHPKPDLETVLRNQGWTTTSEVPEDESNRQNPEVLLPRDDKDEQRQEAQVPCRSSF